MARRRSAGASASSGKARNIAVAGATRSGTAAARCTNAFERIAPINLWNLDKKLTQTGPGTLSWEALTTGGFGGFDAWLADPRSGTLRIDTALVKCEIAVAHIGLDDLVFEAGGIGRRIRMFRLPDENPHRRLHLSRRIPLKRSGDNAAYVCLTQEDGHLIWSSPIYVFR
jgi:hypothetical protein